jgi:hypothetical protein
MKKVSKIQSTESEIATFRRIRRSIGWLGIGLPIVLFVLSFIAFFSTPVQPSISHYYYTNFREIFTGILCGVGLFLIRYKGTRNKVFWKNDSLLTNIAGYMAFGIAFFPTNPVEWSEKIYTLIPLDYNVLGYIHYGFAAVFFLILANISINVFTIGQEKNPGIPVSFYNENRIYRISGYMILFSIIMIVVFGKLDIFPYSTLLFEAVALFFFGTSWLIKGRVLGDKGQIGRNLYREVH